MLIASASTKALNANDSTECRVTKRRISRVVTATSEVCAVAAIVGFATLPLPRAVAAAQVEGVFFQGVPVVRKQLRLNIFH